MIKVGIVGAGIGRLHAMGYGKCPDVQIKTICDVDSDRAKCFAQEFGVESTITDYVEMMQDPQIQAVSVCTPNSFHAPVAIAAFQTGKHVLCEKPLALNAQEGADHRRSRKEGGQDPDDGLQ